MQGDSLTATATAFTSGLDAGPSRLVTRRCEIVATVANIGGLAVGPVIAGVLARHEAHGLTLPYVVFLAGLALAVVAVILAPEGHAAVHRRLRCHAQRLAAPANARRAIRRSDRRRFHVIRDLRTVRRVGRNVPGRPLHHPSPALFGLTILLTFSAGVLVQTTTLVILASGADDRAGALATFFTAVYAGVSVRVVGIGTALQRLSPRWTLLIFAIGAGLGILAAVPVLVRRLDASPKRQGLAMSTLGSRSIT